MMNIAEFQNIGAEIALQMVQNKINKADFISGKDFIGLKEMNNEMTSEDYEIVSYDVRFCA